MAIANGSLNDADEVLQVTKIQELYTGSGFSTSGSTTVEASHELTAVASTDLASANYAQITIVGIANTNWVSSAISVQIKAQIKETGGSYADVLAYQYVKTARTAPADYSESVIVTYPIIATLTEGMKTNGFQVKLFSKISLSNGSASFSNIQTTLEVKP